MKTTARDDIIEDSRGNNIPFHAFQSLLPPSNISNELVDFFTNVFNTRAIPGRIALPVAYGVLESSRGTLEDFLKGLSAQPEGPGAVLERVLCPFIIKEATIRIMILASTSMIIVYNWVNQHSLADGVVQVFY